MKIKAHYIATATMFLHIFMCVHTCIHTYTDIDQTLLAIVLSIRFLHYEASGTRGYTITFCKSIVQAIPHIHNYNSDYLIAMRTHK